MFAGELGEFGDRLVFRALSISSIIRSLLDFNHCFVIFSTDSRFELEKLIWFCYQMSSSSPRSWKILGSQSSHLLTPFSGMSFKFVLVSYVTSFPSQANMCRF